MDSKKTEKPSYEVPKVADYGNLTELTQAASTVGGRDMPRGRSNTAFPNS
jgi:hypothetical protein